MILTDLIVGHIKIVVTQDLRAVLQQRIVPGNIRVIALIVQKDQQPGVLHTSGGSCNIKALDPGLTQQQLIGMAVTGADRFSFDQRPVCILIVDRRLVNHIVDHIIMQIQRLLIIVALCALDDILHFGIQGLDGIF